MKKVVLLFILFVFSLSRADAQEFHFIPRIGLNLANTYPESFADMRTKKKTLKARQPG